MSGLEIVEINARYADMKGIMFDEYDEQWRRIRYLVTRSRRLRHTFGVQIVCSGISCNAGDRIPTSGLNGDFDETRWVSTGWDIEVDEVIEVVGLHDSISQAVHMELDTRLRVCKQDATTPLQDRDGVFKLAADEAQDSEGPYNHTVDAELQKWEMAFKNDLAEDHEWKAASSESGMMRTGRAGTTLRLTVSTTGGWDRMAAH